MLNVAEPCFRTSQTRVKVSSATAINIGEGFKHPTGADQTKVTGRDAGLVVTIPSFYYVDPSSTPSEVYLKFFLFDCSLKRAQINKTDWYIF